MPGGKLAGREGQHRAGLVQRDESLDVARVGPGEEEPAEVLRLDGRLALWLGRRPAFSLDVRLAFAFWLGRRPVFRLDCHRCCPSLAGCRCRP